jgi:hypothetical protein
MTFSSGSGSASEAPWMMVSRVADGSLRLGAFEPTPALVFSDGTPPRRRMTSGGPVSLHDALILTVQVSSISQVLPCQPPQFLNRYVRPILRALSACGVHAAYFGRDWIAARDSASGTHHPIALLATGHDRASGRARVDCFIGLSEPVIPLFDSERASFQGKHPRSCFDVAYQAQEGFAAKLEDALVIQWQQAGVNILRDLQHPSLSTVPCDTPYPVATPEIAWQEPIGTLTLSWCEHSVRLQGPFMLSGDAHAELERVGTEYVLAFVEEDEAHARERVERLRHRLEQAVSGSVHLGVKSWSAVADIVHSLACKLHIQNAK